MSLLARLAGCKFNRWRSWKIALYMLIACPLLATPVTSFAQSCGVTPASWVYFYDNWDLEGTAPTASEACAAFLGNTWSIGSNNLSTVVSSVVNAGSIGLPGPGAHAGCSQVFVSTNYPNPGQPINIGLTPQHGSCPNFFVVATPPRRAEVSCKNCVSDPIDPGIGNVYKTEEDVSVANSNSGIAFRRFYNSADTFGADGVLGWRHSYGRSVSTVYQTASSPYPGQSAIVSAEYGTPQDACVQGFLAIRASVGAWQSATATYTNGVCVLSIATGTIGTLQIQLDTPMAPPASPIEYDLVRDDGQVLRYTLQNGTINNPPGSSMQLAVTSSGFTATDDQDNIERYDSNGVLQSITGRAGVVQTVSYDSNGLFNGVTDSFGNSLTATRNTQGSIATVAINGGGAVQYSYDSAGRLTTVINQDNTTKRYTYGGANSLLASTIDENGTTYTTWTYNAQKQATNTAESGGANATTITYNTDGSTTVTDALGAVRTFGYSRVGDINRTSSISGSQCPSCEEMAQTTYDAFGWVSSRTDYNGNVTCYTNDPTRGLELVRLEGFASGSTCPTNLSTYSPASGTTQRKISTTWSTAYRLPTLITEATRTTAFAYDSSGNLLTRTVTDTTVTPNVLRTWTYTYDSFGRVLTAKGPRTDVNSTQTYAYYSCASGAQCGQVQTVTDELGHVTTFNTYNAYGQSLTITDPNGVVTTLTYDARQRLTSRSTASETMRISYYPTGLVNRVTLPDSSFLQYTYDGAHRLTQIADSLGNHVAYTLDAMGNHTAESLYDPSNALTRTRTQVFNTLSELSQQIGSAGTAAVTTGFGYDRNGNQTSINAPLTRNTANQYDALNRLQQVTDPGNGVTQFSYDSNDNLTAVVDPRSLTTGYSYDGFGDLIQQTSPDTGITVNSYDSGGNLATSTDARSQTGTYSYDARNRVTQIAYADQTLTFGYDSGTNGVGHLTSAADANHSLAWTYDALGRVTGKTQTVGTGISAVTKSVGYTYTNGDLTSLVTPSGQTVTYGYTSGQVTSISVNGNPLLSQVLYEPFGPVSGWTWANNTNEARIYDQDGNLTTLESAEGFTYAYDNAFRITGITDTDNSALSQSYGYDALDHLTTATGTALNETWTYDANGNRQTQGGATSSTYTVATASNRPTGISGGLTRTYAYAPSGQTTRYGGLTFTYMDSGRLSSVSNGSTTTTYVLNALGQRVKKSGTSITLFVYDEPGHLLGEYDGSGNLIEETVWMGDVPVATLRPNGTGVSVYYIHTDHLNTPRRISRPADNVIVWRWDSEPFGTATANQDPDGDGIAFVYNPRLPGQYFDAETGLNYNYMRDYDPATGRYVESDPIGLAGGSFSPYVYVGAGPLTSSDPLGLWGTDAHNAIIQYSFPGLPPDYLAEIMAGSGSVDSIFNQFGDTNYMHAMRGANETPDEARRKACDFVKNHMAQYERLMNLANTASVFRAEAYRQLGMALHPIMDSTSPMHEGWQVWDPWNDWVWHGNAHGSLEGLNALAKQKLQKTRDLINNAMKGHDCFCNQ